MGKEFNEFTLSNKAKRNARALLIFSLFIGGLITLQSIINIINEVNVFLSWLIIAVNTITIFIVRWFISWRTFNKED